MKPVEHRLPVLVALPLAVGGGAAASVGGYPVVLLLPLFGTIFARAFFEDQGRAYVPERASRIARLLLAGAAGWYLFSRGGDAGRGPLIAFLTLVTLLEVLLLVGAQSAFRTFLLLSMSATQVLSVAFLAKDLRGLAMVVAYVAALAPGLVQFERHAFALARGRREPGVRFLTVSGRIVPPVGATLAVALRLLAIGLPLGLLLYASLPRYDDAKRTEEARSAPFESRGGAEPAEEPASDLARRPPGEARTGARVGAKLGFVATMKRDLTPALRVKPDWARADEDEPKGPPLLLRSTAYTDLKDGMWERASISAASWRSRDEDDGEKDGWIRVAGRPLVGVVRTLRVTDLRGGAGGQLFLAPEAEAVRFERAAPGTPVVIIPLDGTALSSIALAPGDAYVERARTPVPTASELGYAKSDAATAPLSAYVAEPGEIDGLRVLALEAVGTSKTASQHALAISAWLRSHCSYTLAVPEVDPRRPVHDFLFRVRRGHCEYFASAMTLLMRALGHPARLAVGFRGGDWQKSLGEYLVRGSHAHAWTEVWYEGIGWVDYDPTPPDERATDATTVTGADGTDEEADGTGAAWRLLRFSAEDRRWFGQQVAAAFEAVVARPARFIARKDVWPFVAGGALLVFAFAGFARRRRGPSGGMAAGGAAPPVVSRRPYERAVAALAKAGVRRKASMTATEFLRAASSGVPPAALPLSRLTRAFEGERYGAHPGPDRGEAEADADAVAIAARAAHAAN